MKFKFNKNDARYWMRKVSFHTKDSRTYSVHIQHDNKRRRVGLKITDKEQAGALALQFYVKLRALGWDETLRWWKGDASISTKKTDVTVGEYLEAVRAKSLIHAKTLESYAGALRKIAADIRNVAHNGKRSTWREQVDAIKLDTLTNQAIEEWRTNFIKRGSTNPLKEKSAKSRRTAPSGGHARSSARRLSPGSEMSSNFRIPFPSPA